ncbi:MAG: response regulator receiver protein [Conexibacter sp.]|nr:response regulator receiver protein [Conexibacter sp.]
MSRVLIAEPSADIRALLEHVVARAGHYPIRYQRSRHGRLPDVDVLLLEPALVGGIELASRVRTEQPHVAIVICSIFSPGPQTQELDPVAHVLKPFPRETLEDALRLAIATAARSAC